ncbi:MAG: ATP-binding protein [Elusimicrobiota bacterium]
MEIVIFVLIPVVFLVLASSMLVVSQVSSLFQTTRYSKKRRLDRENIERNLLKLAVEKARVARRSKQLEGLSKRLQATNVDLDRLNSMKTKFLSMAVHDMRTPLASIKGFGEMLSRQQLAGTQKKYVDYIVRGTDQINRLMADLTDLAVIEAGKLKMEKVPFQLSDLLQDIVPPIQVIAEKAGVEFIPPEDPKEVTIIGDKFRLGQALNNFLNNACKFTPAGGRFELIIKAIGRTVTFGVKDTGPGIDRSEVEFVFEKFYQSKYTKKADKKKGWGLGLSITQEIVRAHFGDIGVDSPGLGKGSTFWCSIPLKPPRQARLPVAVAALLLALGLAAAPLRAADLMPLEEKARYEAALEQKAESVLLRILGPNRARVVVNATLDFTRTERFDVKSGGAEDQNAASLYLWQSVGAEGAGRSQLLPGIPSPETVPALTESKSYERSNTFPTSFIKKLEVTIIYDDSVPLERIDAINKIIPDVLNMETGPPREDMLSFARSPFQPAWKTIWYTPESASLLFKYGIISLMTLITLLVVAACFLKLADAMDSMAQSQSNQLKMDIGDEGEPIETDAEGAEKKDGEGDGPPPESQIIINVHLSQVDTLLEILSRQDPENIALIVAHLKPEVKKAFLRRLPPEIYSRVLMNLGKIKFMEPDTVATVKDELERRLESAVGGHGKLLEMIEDSDLRSKKELLHLLEQREPELAKIVRSRILLFEDLLNLLPKEWSIVLGSVSLEDWGAALYDSDDVMREAVQAQMLPKTWSILSQMMDVAKSTAAAGDQARERIVETVARLAAEARIGNPGLRKAAQADALDGVAPLLEEALGESSVETG